MSSNLSSATYSFFTLFIFPTSSWIFWKKSEKIMDKIPWNLRITWLLTTNYKTKAPLVFRILETELPFSLQLHISVCINIVMICSPKNIHDPPPACKNHNGCLIIFQWICFYLWHPQCFEKYILSFKPVSNGVIWSFDEIRIQGGKIV